MSDDIDEFRDRLDYHMYLNDRSKPMLEFEEWRAKRPVVTNPATRSDV